MMIAAKTLALTGMQLFDDPVFIRQVQKEFMEIRGTDFEYIPLLGDRKPCVWITEIKAFWLSRGSAWFWSEERA